MFDFFQVDLTNRRVFEKGQKVALSSCRRPIELEPFLRQHVWARHSVANFRVITGDVGIGWRPLHNRRSIDRFGVLNSQMLLLLLLHVLGLDLLLMVLHLVLLLNMELRMLKCLLLHWQSGCDKHWGIFGIANGQSNM